MAIQRLASFGFLAVLPFLAACNQTASSPATPPLDAATVGPGAMAALDDVERTREKHKSEAAGMAVMSFFDPIGITDIAEPAMEAEHQREMDEKYRRVEEELRKTVAETEALKAQAQANAARTKVRRRERSAAE
uniref:Uncharacterized protein n=1 Tax=Microvirga lupini TaxID=420324 RepID=A0A7W4YYF7_9HYPH|nr:hypothetical protein [Microvirga lupini]MBB3021592.1 hypothetical protein [Microvirga lupini]